MISFLKIKINKHLIIYQHFKLYFFMKQIRLFSLILVLCLFMAGTTARAQAVGDYGSKATGNWGTDGSNWIVCVADGTWAGATDAPGAPTSTNNVWIRSGHEVTVEATGKVCNNITVENGATVIYTSAYITGTTGSVLTLLANSYWKQAGTSSAMPCTTKSFDATSTVEFNGTQSSLSVYTYGNLKWSSSNTCGISQGNNLTVNGNLTLKKNMRGNSSTSGTNTHFISGNVIVDGSGVYWTGVNNTSATTGNAIWTVGGNVTLLNAARLVLFESAGPHTGTATFNINGNLEIGSTTNTMVQLRSSSTVNASSGVGTINVKGNIINNGGIQTTSGATGGSSLTINLNGLSAQNWTGVFPVNFPSGQSCNVNINNAAGLILNSAATINTNVNLQFNTGLLKLGDNNLSVGTGTLTGVNSTNYIVTDGTGTLTMPAPAGVATLFPVGASASSYDPVTVKPTTASNFSVKVGTTLSGSAVNCTLNEKEWDITPVTPSETELTFTPSAISATGLDPIIGHFESGAYKYKIAKQTGNSYTATFSSFSPFVTGASDVISATENISNALFVSMIGGKAYLNGTTEGQLISVYGTNGQLIKNLVATGNYTALQLIKGIYVVKVSNETMKVVL